MMIFDKPQGYDEVQAGGDFTPIRRSQVSD